MHLKLFFSVLAQAGTIKISMSYSSAGFYRNLNNAWPLLSGTQRKEGRSWKALIFINSLSRVWVWGEKVTKHFKTMIYLQTLGDVKEDDHSSHLKERELEKPGMLACGCALGDGYMLTVVLVKLFVVFLFRLSLNHGQYYRIPFQTVSQRS